MFADLLAAEAGAAAGFPTLTMLIVVPALGALLIALTPKGRVEAHRLLAVLATTITGAASVWVLLDFDGSEGGFQMRSADPQVWIEGLGISWDLGVDGISLFLIVLTGFLFPLAILGVKPEHDDKAYYAWLVVLEAGVMGVFLTMDLFFFFVFFEIVLVPMYFLIGNWGHGNRKYAATKFFLYTMFGSALMLVGILATVFLTASATGNDPTFNIVTLAETQALSMTAGRWIFLSFALAFAVKVPIFPVHTWLPDAHTEAPTAGSVILAGVMLKLGTYGFLRFGLYMFPEAAVWFAPVMMVLGTVGIIYGAVAATMQKDLKRLVAYSSVAHLGFIVLGTFAITTEALTGSVMQMVNHGLSTGALFFLVGWMYERRHTREIAALGGLQKAAPVFAAAFTLVMLSSVGLPGLNGFVGEFLILLGAFVASPWIASIAATGVILAALYLLWAYQRVFHGPAEGENAEMAELKVSEGLVLLPMLVLIVFLGVYPKPMLERIEPAVEELVSHVELHVPDWSEPTADVILPSDDDHHSDDDGEDH
ncbi:MAG: NADH-quinone oxidoreductase subunit M [Acidimicrobiales bacterium]|nr:NADH-quinone oxidoreductase subunit M [Acidimicrobiales bacterium]RZV47953.1 MAG: NADH-quinone oxidoreductase subunit M [Acidimicrobiales bacterium]